MSVLTEQEQTTQLNAAGWPRPKAHTNYDGREKTWPVPFISRVSDDGLVDLGAKDLKHAECCVSDFVCQVCGAQGGDVIYAPATKDDRRSGFLSVDGGSVCSVRCAKMAIAWCPHFHASNKPFIAFFRREDAKAVGMSSAFQVETWTEVERKKS